MSNSAKGDCMSTTSYLLIAVAVVVVFLVIVYNRLVALRQAYKSAYADIDVQLKQRHDLVPNLVETVKGYAAHESGVFEKVTQARASALGAASVRERGQAEGALTAAIGQLLAVAENYPQLKASENFRQLQGGEPERRHGLAPEGDLWHLARRGLLASIEREHVGMGKAQRAREQDRGELLDMRIVLGDRIVEEAARRGDLVLEIFQLRQQSQIDPPAGGGCSARCSTSCQPCSAERC